MMTRFAVPSCPLPCRSAPCGPLARAGGPGRGRRARPGPGSTPRTAHQAPGGPCWPVPARRGPRPLGGKVGVPVWSEVLFFSILLPYQGLSSLLTLQRPEEVRPFEGALRILPACWGPSSHLPQRFGCPPPERSLTLSLVHPSGTSATSACSSVLSFSSFLFLISRQSQTLICHLFY